MIDQARLVVELALGLVFLASAAGKLRDPAAFARGVVSYELLPRGLALAAGYVLIPFEALLAVAHLTGWQLRPGALLGLLTLLGFAAGVAVNLKRGRGLPCFCFSARGGELLSARTLARLGLMIAGETLVLTDAALWNGPASAALFPGRLAAGSDLVHALLLAVATLCAAFWLLSAPDLVYMVRGCAACARDAAADGSGVAA